MYWQIFVIEKSYKCGNISNCSDFTYFFHDNKDHISGRKPLQYQLIISILSGVKHPSPISTPKIARYENRDKRCFQSLKTSLNY